MSFQASKNSKNRVLNLSVNSSKTIFKFMMININMNFKLAFNIDLLNILLIDENMFQILCKRH